MVIKSPKENHIVISIIILCIEIASLIETKITGEFSFIIFMTLINIILVRYWISIGRTLIMNEEGCTVKFFWYSRTYSWSELETKQIEDYTHSYGGRQPYKAGAIFYHKQTKKPSWLPPDGWSVFLHPFSFVFVLFNPHVEYKAAVAYPYPDAYLVEETEFRKKMAEWNVELKDNR